MAGPYHAVRRLLRLALLPPPPPTSLLLLAILFLHPLVLLRDCRDASKAPARVSRDERFTPLPPAPSSLLIAPSLLFQGCLKYFWKVKVSDRYYAE